ncbi:MAG: DUF3309 domain-containing protein, partial [Candidatus Acidiferrales bacterium]
GATSMQASRVAPASLANWQCWFRSSCKERKEEETMLGTILIVFLILALVGALPRWSHSREWGYYPTGGLGLVLIVVVVLLLLGRR